MKRLALFIAVIAVGLAAAVAGGIAAQRKLQDDALSDAFARLRLFHELRRAALEDYLKSMASDVRAASENPRVVDATEKLAFAWSAVGPDARKLLRISPRTRTRPASATSSTPSTTTPTTRAITAPSTTGRRGSESISAITTSS
jgi:hypothetical protein